MLYTKSLSSCQDFVTLCEQARGLPKDVTQDSVNNFLRVLNAVIVVTAIPSDKDDVVDEQSEKKKKVIHYKALIELFKYLRGDYMVLKFYTPQ